MLSTLATIGTSAWRSTCGCNPPPAPTCLQRGAVAIAPAVDIEPAHSTRLWTAPTGCAQCPPLPDSCAPAVDSSAAHTRACSTRLRSRTRGSKAGFAATCPGGRREGGSEQGKGFALPRRGVVGPAFPAPLAVGRSVGRVGPGKPAGASRGPRSWICSTPSPVAAWWPLGWRSGRASRSSALRAACASRESGLGGQVEKSPRLIDVQHAQPGART